mmetsp:Transcript_104480/g.294453  ORF Transcript_104480/g.294453 Transcript_104480/m.294453 type:complete len:209 (-) Transcript_104480:1159-1785(-)
MHHHLAHHDRRKRCGDHRCFDGLEPFDGPREQAHGDNRRGSSRDDGRAQESHSTRHAADESEEQGPHHRQRCRLLCGRAEGRSSERNLRICVLRNEHDVSGEAIRETLLAPANALHDWVRCNSISIPCPFDQKAHQLRKRDYERAHGKRADVVPQTVSEGTQCQPAVAQCVATISGRLPPAHRVHRREIPSAHSEAGPKVAHCMQQID